MKTEIQADMPPVPGVNADRVAAIANDLAEILDDDPEDLSRPFELLLTQKEVAAEIGVTDRRVRQLEDEGGITFRLPDGNYPAAAVRYYGLTREMRMRDRTRICRVGDWLTQGVCDEIRAEIWHLAGATRPEDRIYRPPERIRETVGLAERLAAVDSPQAAREWLVAYALTLARGWQSPVHKDDAMI